MKCTLIAVAIFDMLVALASILRVDILWTLALNSVTCFCDITHIRCPSANCFGRFQLTAAAATAPRTALGPCGVSTRAGVAAWVLAVLGVATVTVFAWIEVVISAQPLIVQPSTFYWFIHQTAT